jgi:hypothetical protein
MKAPFGRCSNLASFIGDYSTKCMQQFVFTAEPATVMVWIPTPFAAVAGRMISPFGAATQRKVARWFCAHWSMITSAV